MNWTDIQIQIDTKEVETASAICQMVVPYGIYIEDYSDLKEQVLEIAHIDLIDEELLAKQRDVAIIHIYVNENVSPAEAISFLTYRFEEEKIAFSVSTAQMQEEDWAFGWKKYYHPMEIGQKLVICPSWEDYDNKQGRAVLKLDPGMAFGTGTHETTRLCLTLLEEYLHEGDSMLDVGCGSGILAIAGVLLGAKEALGVDIDPMSVKVAKENAQLNATGEKATFLCGDLTQSISPRPFQVICANIVADVIIRLSKDLLPYLAQGGTFLASGIIDDRADEVIEKLTLIGLRVVQRRDESGWVALACQREG